MRKCLRCKADSLKFQTIDYSQEFKGLFYIIENVPAWVCEQCGEIILSESVATEIQELVWSGASPKRTEQVPVYEPTFQRSNVQTF